MSRKNPFNHPLTGIFKFLARPWWTAIVLLHPNVGREYAIGIGTKLSLLHKMWRNSRHPGSASGFFEHVYIATKLLEVPSDIEGSVGEFGCFKGLSTASLSLTCALTNRRLIAFDSFEGLPEPEQTVHNFDINYSPVRYHRGQYAGSLEEVRANVARFGEIGVCEFVKGYFEDTLPNRDKSERFVLIFEDADLPQSVRSVLCGVWRKLYPGCLFFCHEARDREVIDIFFDQQWWVQTIGEKAPGFMGSGSGMLSGPGLDLCCLGFAIRVCNESDEIAPL